MKDKFSRDITYARISLTESCNLRCKYCKPECFKPYESRFLTDDELEKLVCALIRNGIKKIRFTGGEPMMRPDCIKLFEKLCRDKSAVYAMTTNGLNLKNQAENLVKAGISHINISLDTLDESDYHTLTGGNVQDVLDGIKAALEAGFKTVRINAVLVKGISERQIEKLAKLTLKYPVDVRFIELMPMGHCASWANEHLLSANVVFETLTNTVDTVQDKHAPAHYIKLRGAKGRIGVITPISCDFCYDCNRIRITADGKIKPCLHSNLEIDIIDVINDDKKLDERLRNAVYAKPEKHHLNEKIYTDRDMSRTGG